MIILIIYIYLIVDEPNYCHKHSKIYKREIVKITFQKFRVDYGL
jgi:hypothetical protein